MNSITATMGKKGPTWSREFDSLIRAIGECKSKAEEDALISREVEILKPRLKDPKMDKRWLKELLVRLIYVEMLGQDASWAHVKALQACSETNLLTKKASIETMSDYAHTRQPVPTTASVTSGKHSHAMPTWCIMQCACMLQVAYLASSLFLDYKDDTIILVVNTLSTDLRSDNYLIGELHSTHCLRHRCRLVNSPAQPKLNWHLAAVCAALTAICKLISPDLINAVLPRTVELLTHQRELVRKKAVMALHRYLQLDPERDGPLAGIDLDRHLRQALCDKV